VSSALFTIPLWLDLTAVAIGAIQGAMFAARLTERRIDLLGVALIGVIVGLGRRVCGPWDDEGCPSTEMKPSCCAPTSWARPTASSPC